MLPCILYIFVNAYVRVDMRAFLTPTCPSLLPIMPRFRTDTEPFHTSYLSQVTGLDIKSSQDGELVFSIVDSDIHVVSIRGTLKMRFYRQMLVSSLLFVLFSSLKVLTPDQRLKTGWRSPYSSLMLRNTTSVREKQSTLFKRNLIGNNLLLVVDTVSYQPSLMYPYLLQVHGILDCPQYNSLRRQQQATERSDVVDTLFRCEGVLCRLL